MSTVADRTDIPAQRNDSYSQLIGKKQDKSNRTILAWTGAGLLSLVLVLLVVKVNSLYSTQEDLLEKLNAQDQKLSSLVGLIEKMSHEQQLNHVQTSSLLQVQNLVQKAAPVEETSPAENNIISAVAVSGESQLRTVSPKFVCLIKSPIPQFGSDQEYANVLSARNLTGGWRAVVEGLDKAGEIKKTPGVVTFGEIRKSDSIYYGEIVNGVANGFGRQVYTNTNTVIEGHFTNGNVNGFAIDTYGQDGTYYTGTWNNGYWKKGISYDKYGCVDETINR